MHQCGVVQGQQLGGSALYVWVFPVMSLHAGQPGREQDEAIGAVCVCVSAECFCLGWSAWLALCVWGCVCDSWEHMLNLATGWAGGSVASLRVPDSATLTPRWFTA